MRPLEGITVLDLSRILTGPYCSMMLADMGADVIKVERPGAGDDTRAMGPPFVNGESAYYLSINRNKKSITLNLKEPEAKDIFLGLAAKADVILENFRPGTVDRLGIGYDVVSKVNPRIVYCSISGFGQDGPYRDRPGYDLILQGMGGLMGITGSEEANEPVRVGVAIADIGAGMFAAFAVLTALFHRERAGVGQYIDVSLLDGQIAWLTYMAGNYFATGEQPQKRANAHPNIVPYQSFRASDRYFNIAVGNDRLYRKFCDVVGLDPDDPRFLTNADRVGRREELVGIIQDILVEKPAAHWLQAFEAAGIPCGPIYNMQDIFTDSHVLSREMLVQLDHPVAGPIKVTGIPMKFSRTPGTIVTPPPVLGEHNETILAEMGFDAEAVADLKQRGVI